MTLGLVGVCLLPAVWLSGPAATSALLDATADGSVMACGRTSSDDPATIVRCSADGEYRILALIGESGDGVIKVESKTGEGWRRVFRGPTCVSGVAGVTVDQLLTLGVPVGAADELGDPPDVCGPMGRLW